MNIDMKSTADELNAISKRFNDPIHQSAENSYLCICAIEDIANGLLTFVENYKPTYRKIITEWFRKDAKIAKKV